MRRSGSSSVANDRHADANPDAMDPSGTRSSKRSREIWKRRSTSGARRIGVRLARALRDHGERDELLLPEDRRSGVLRLRLPSGLDGDRLGGMVGVAHGKSEFHPAGAPPQLNGTGNAQSRPSAVPTSRRLVVVSNVGMPVWFPRLTCASSMPVSTLS